MSNLIVMANLMDSWNDMPDVAKLILFGAVALLVYVNFLMPKSTGATPSVSGAVPAKPSPLAGVGVELSNLWQEVTKSGAKSAAPLVPAEKSVVAAQEVVSTVPDIVTVVSHWQKLRDDVAKSGNPTVISAVDAMFCQLNTNVQPIPVAPPASGVKS